MFRRAGPACLVPVLLCVTFPALGQQGEPAKAVSAPGKAGTAKVFIAALEGGWIRNEEASEDPIQKTASLWRDPNRTSAPLIALSASLARRVGHLRISLEYGQVRLRNAEFEVVEFPADGSIVVDRFGNRHRASVLPGVLEIETVRPGWLLIETFYLQAGQLHRVIEIQSERFPNLRFLTVYQRHGGAPPMANFPAGDANRFSRPAAIRIVPPRRGHGELITGRVQVETLIVDQTIGSVEFFLDGRRQKRVRKPPFRTQLNLAQPPREQVLEVRAYSIRGAFVGEDRIVLNRVDPPFGVRIGAVTPRESDGAAVDVEVRVAVPQGATLERVSFYRNDQLVETVGNLARDDVKGGFKRVRAHLATHELSPQDYVRVTARLADGRELEDAQLLEGVTFKGEIDVQLVHLQVLVVDAEGAPVGGLTAADFRIIEDGERKAAEEVQQAGEVPLLLGMAIDSSASMKPVWNQLRSVAGAFLETSLAAEDRAFLVDFDESIRLLQPLTGTTRTLRARLERLIPNGGTALNDGVLFSLVQYENEPGRRALIVVTDGMDIDSRSEPEQAAGFAERTGIPIYFIDLGRDRIALADGHTPDGESAGAGLMRTARSGDHVLRMERQAQQSGGRLFGIDPELPPPDFLDEVRQVFDQIREDLRRQHVLAYYSNRPVGAAIEPGVQVLRDGLTVKSVLPLDGVD